MKIENNTTDKLWYKNKYWYTRLGALLVFLVFYHHKTPVQAGHAGQGFKDHVNTLPNINIYILHYIYTA